MQNLLPYATQRIARLSFVFCLLFSIQIAQAFNSGVVKYSAKSITSMAKAPLQAGIYFVGGTPQSLTVSENAAATSINSYLTIGDISGRTVTWTVQSNASHGTIITGGTQTSTGSPIAPTGFTYQPTAGYSGTDAFTIHVSDGTNTANTT